ncbi:MAG TPA: ATP-binding protein [Zoogloea sp.]|uniref:sensor histidine kinase n=1 Tax=Zoogloea sp. TaxID=49181 RepID=UPI002BA6D694|nr:ATP-binding protein [Zoogloea sp.]HOB44652.1 ATP-binding protein [Zoogloea sp.]HQA10960.1 ATP-binding protein [Zoogloea sp.]HQE38882.1 ATP-binding protein [Zoogloea sp.]
MRSTVLVVAAAISGILLFLLATASANTPLFARNYTLLLALNGAIALGLASLVFVQLRSLWREYRERRFGSRLKLRLMTIFAAMAVVPGVLVYAVSLQFAVKSIESWFNVRVDAALESGLQLGRTTLDILLDQLAAKADQMALELEVAPQIRSPLLNRLRERNAVESATVFSPVGQIVATADTQLDTLLPEQPSVAQLRQGRQGYRATESHAGAGLILRVIVPIPPRHLSEPQLLQVTQAVPRSFSMHAESVETVHRDYQELSLARNGLKRIYTLTLTLTLLLALFAAVAVAFVLTRRLAAPLFILAEGTQAVAAGDFSPRQALPARDELGVLTQSFNQMTRQLEDAREQAENNRAAVERNRAYLESVLANLSAGVLAFSPDGHLRAANHGAMTILNDELHDYERTRIDDWQAHAAFRDAVVEGFHAPEADWNRQIEFSNPDGSAQTLLLHGTRLPDSTGGGWVVVFDDITHLIVAQRTAAWAEVARRLAHEIKNPLTPIQLSAERLQFKLADRLDPEGRVMLERATTTIVNQVEAMKNLVNAFRDYARLPSPTMAPVDINALVREVLVLYEGSRVMIHAELAADANPVLGDATQLRQVIHNLLQNAEDALADEAHPQITLLTRTDARRVDLILRDNGSGFPPEILTRAFEPYVTTKARGTGLGLAIVKKIIDEHGGEIRVANRETGGAEIRIRLRCAPHQESPAHG